MQGRVFAFIVAVRMGIGPSFTAFQCVEVRLLKNILKQERIIIYIVLKDQTNEIALKLSQNPTAPDGYTEDNSQKIGGFHTLCADVGEIEGHLLSGYQAGDILPNSVWCLNHRPRSDPEGMVYNPWHNIWVDIYLQSGTGVNAKSAYGVPITTNRSYADHAFDFWSVNKRFLTSDEFSPSMYGSNQATSIVGNQAPSLKTSGGHVDTNNRRMISHIGCEDGAVMFGNICLVVIQ